MVNVVAGVNEDRVLTYVYVRTGVDTWPWTEVGWVLHRADLSDLDEPYLSAVIAARGGALWFWL